MQRDMVRRFFLRFIVICIIAPAPACSIINNELDEHRSYWKKTLDSNIPIGTKRADVIAWAENFSPHFYKIVKQDAQHADGRVLNPEITYEHILCFTEKIAGIYPCASFSFTLDFKFNESGILISKRLIESASCI